MADPGEHDSGRDAEHEHEHIGIEGGGEGERCPRNGGGTQRSRVHPRVTPLHPDAQPSGLVVLELEQMEHEVQPPRDEHERAGCGDDQPDGGHRFAASRGCSSRKRRATARNWPGASA